MKLVLQRTKKEVERTEEYKLVPVLDDDGKETGKKERQYTGDFKEVETGVDVVETKHVHLVDYKEAKDKLKANGWEVIGEANIIDLKKHAFFEGEDKKVEY